MSTSFQHSRRRAAKAGLRYVSDFSAGYTRRRCGRGFTYLDEDGKTIRSSSVRKRIESLVIPPAWQEVWICPTSDGHIQAKGRDDAGRTQYIYHEHWQAISSAKKFDRMARFVEVLPRIRRRVRRDLNQDGLCRGRVLAAIVRLLDKAQLRIGNARSVEARGATTLDSEHVELDGFQVILDFPGKSGQRREVEFRDAKVSKVIQHCEELDGQYLFGYVDDQQNERRVHSTDVNEYLNEIAKERVTAKDFRTWWGSVTALSELRDLPADATARDRRTAVRRAVKTASAALGNTMAVCRSSYIHPGLLTAAETGELPTLLADITDEPIAELTQDEVLMKLLLPGLDFT